MPEITRDDYLTIGGVVLATPAWRLLDLSPLYDLPETRGQDDVIPTREGVTARRRIPTGRSVDLPMMLNGHKDQDGADYDDPRAGLQINRDILAVALKASQARKSPAKSITFNRIDGKVLDGFGHTDLDVNVRGKGVARAVLTLELMGLWRDNANQESAQSSSVADGATENLIVPNPGTADQMRSTILISGSATSVRLSNLTWDADGDVWLDYLGDLTQGDVSIDTWTWTADRSGLSVIGLIRHNGHEQLFPLASGDNTIEVAPTGGTAQVTISHYPAYL